MNGSPVFEIDALRAVAAVVVAAGIIAGTLVGRETGNGWLALGIALAGVVLCLVLLALSGIWRACEVTARIQPRCNRPWR